MLWVALHFPCLPPHALPPIAAWACQFTPRVSLEPPQELVLEIEGSLRLFGGLGRLEEKLRLGANALGFAFHMATAATPRAALWLARGKAAALEVLPLEVMRLEDTAFLKSKILG